MRKRCGTIFSAVMIPAAALSGIRVCVSADGAPENIVAMANCDFENGLTGWTNRHSNKVCCVELEGRGKALSFSAGAGKSTTVNRYVKVNPAWKGRTYAISCDIQPSKEVSSKALSDSKSGLGCTLSFWNADWTRNEGVGCMADGPDRWFRVSSKPITVPEWADRMNITVGLSYSKGSGFVDNVTVYESSASITAVVESGASIRQVKVMDEGGGTVFDSGLIDGGGLWTRRIPIGSSRRWKIFAVDSEGSVAVSEAANAEEDLKGESK